MYELIQVSEHDYYIDCPSKMGIVRGTGNDVYMIDSGNDSDAAKKALRILEANGWHLAAIFNTHSHADHIGGNHYLQEKTGCKAYIRGLEVCMAENTIFEPIGLYGGLPLAELQNKFTMAKESHVEPLTESVLPEGMKMIGLPGHSFCMTGFLTADGNAFLADTVMAEETLSKYRITYLWDTDLSLRTLEEVKKLKAKTFISSHAETTQDICRLADINAAAIREIQDSILAICKTPKTFDALLRELFEKYHLRMNIQQHALVGSTVRSYLSRLADNGRIRYEFIDSILCWTAL